MNSMKLLLYNIFIILLDVTPENVGHDDENCRFDAVLAVLCLGFNKISSSVDDISMFFNPFFTIFLALNNESVKYMHIVYTNNN